MFSSEATPISTPASTPLAASSDQQSDLPSTSSRASSVESTIENANSPDDIAIIGMACRTPGGNNSPESLWEYLLQKGDASGEMPPMRWEPYRSRNPRNEHFLTRATSKGYFLDRLEDFDASFFGVAPREAEQIDPQQRIALEVAWEALEDAGIPSELLSGSDTGVYMGVNSDDYGRLLLEDLENIGAHMGVGTAYCGIPSRISYHLNLMGPSIAIDAACASSLVAVHHARQALLAGETKLAIAGGVNALIGPGLTRVLDEAGALSADGKCRSFDESASGYGRGEGAGIVVLKRLDQALADGDRIHGVLKGSAVCADGRTVGIMAPNAAAQVLVAQKALNEAKTSAETICYIEAHATSTPLGDPTEMRALSQVYGVGASPCSVGSIKSNIGHLEAGAGVLGLIKAVMVLSHNVVPGQVNLESPSSKIDWSVNKLQVHKSATPLTPLAGTRARAAIASYGYSGTVSHAIIEASPSSSSFEHRSDVGQGRSPVLLFLSAPQANRLPTAAASVARWLESDGKNESLRNIAATLARRRTHHRFRASVTAANTSEAIAALERLANGTQDPSIVSSRVMPDAAAKGPVWVFSGHGAHWPAMGKELLETQPLFTNVIEQLEPIVQQELQFSLTEALKSTREARSDELQIMTFSMHVGVAAVLIEEAGPPSAILGHSLGEAAAAVVAGTLTLQEGALLVCRRARLYRPLIGSGAMALVGIGAAEMKERLGDNKTVDVAVDASPGSCVIAGPKDAVTDLCLHLVQESTQCRTVASDLPFHSRALLDLVEPLRDCLEGEIFPKPPVIPLYSTSNPDSRSIEMRDATYWVNNMVQPVLLRNAVKAISEDGYRAFVEVSSHSIVSHSISETLESEGVVDAAVLPTMLRNKPAMGCILTCVGKLHCFGFRLACTEQLNRPWCPSVPRTKWSHEPYWRAVAKVPLGHTSTHVPTANNLLGAPTSVGGTDTVLYQTQLDETSTPYPGRHPLHGSEIVPAAVLINTFIHAIDSGNGRCLGDVSLNVPVVVSPARDLQILLDRQGITLRSRLSDPNGNGGAWLVNTSAKLAPLTSNLHVATLDLAVLKVRMPRELSPTFSIDYLADMGVPEMAFPWRVTAHFANDDEMLAMVETNPDGLSGLGDLGASIMDAATSISSTLFHQEPLLRMPTAIGRVVTASAATMAELKVGYVYCKKVAGSSCGSDVYVCDESGRVLVLFQNMEFAGIDADHLSRKTTNGLVHRIAWVPATLAEEPPRIGRVVLFGAGSAADPASQRYEKQLVAKGYGVSRTDDAKDLAGLDEGTIVIYLPRPSSSGLAEVASELCDALVSAAKVMASSQSKAKLFALIGAEDDRLATAPLYGLARVINSELPHVWGGLFECEDGLVPITGMKYIQGEDVVRYEDDVGRVARLRPYPQSASNAGPEPNKVVFRPRGTYLITGGLGALGLEIAKWMCESGARRFILVSRRKIPSRAAWGSSADHSGVLNKLRELEDMGATVQVISVDLSASDADVALSNAIDQLWLPAVTGVVHAAGVLHDQSVEKITRDAFDSVLAPKVQGALHLDKLFPPGTLDFFTLFSSCGQLLGFPGQASYASANAFLDSLADRRRGQGDNAVSIQWTSWRGLGMATSTEAVNAELEARGISDITPHEAFMAWDRIASLDASHAVVLRALPLDAGEQVPHPILEGISPRRAPQPVDPGEPKRPSGPLGATSGPEMKKSLLDTLKGAISATLGMAEADIDPSIALAEIGMDSVVTVLFRSKVQKLLKIKMAPTLLWKCPTLNHLVDYFISELQGKE